MNKKRIIVGILILLLIAFIGGGVYFWLNAVSAKNSYAEKEAEFTEMYLAGYAANGFDASPLGNAKAVSKRYHFLEDVYNSDKPVLFYGYETDKKAKKGFLDESFNINLTKELENGDYGKYKIVGFTNLESVVQKYSSNNTDCSTCFEEKFDSEELAELIGMTRQCYVNTCLIDTKKNSYFIIPRIPRLVAGVLKLYK